MKIKLQLSIFLFLISFATYGQSNLEFVANKGQWGNEFLYKCITGNGDIYINNNAITYVLAESGAQEKIDAYRHTASKIPPTIKGHVYKMTFEGAITTPIKEDKVQQHYYNYFLGNDTSKWKSNIHPSLALDFKNMYPNIDMRLTSEGNNPKYDFIVAPNGDPSLIKLKFEGVDKLKIDKSGNLIIKTSVGEVKELKPIAYQYIQGQKVKVDCNYRLKNNTIVFDLPNGYNHSYTLIIDPTIVFSTFSGSTADNWGFTATYDNDGNMYTGGIVSLILGGSYPTTTGAFQSTYGGGSSTTGSKYPCDMAIMKINSAGTAKIYATYLGGADNDQPHSMIVDKNNNLIIAGRTYSSNYPVSTTAYDGTHNGGADIVITVFNPTGTGIVGSTYIGGSGDDCVNFDADEFVGGNLKHNYGDDARSEVIVDDAGNIYLAASTFSTNFPVKNPIQSTLGGGQDAIVLKMNNSVSTMFFSTYLGGTNDDGGYVLALNKAESSIFVGGGTMSTNFPTTFTSYKPSYLGGSADGFLVKISNGPIYNLQVGTFIGAMGYDQVYGVDIDNNDDVYLMGQTLGGGFPVTPGIFSIPNSSQFVMKIDNGLTTPIYSTVFGTGSSSVTDLSPVAFLVDTCENVYISGWGGLLGGSSFPNVGTTTGLPITPGAFQTTTDGSDFYFFVLSKNATTQLFGSFFGRSGSNPLLGEHVDGGTSRFDRNGIIYQAICAGCGGSGAAATAYPTTPGSLSPTNASSNCNLGALKISFELGAVVAKATADPNDTGCAPFTVNFKNTSKNAKTFTWDFADGTPTSTTKEPSHTFTSPGLYKVRMVAYNPDACIEYDTSYVTIFVDDNVMNADFTWVVTDSCEPPYKVQLTNTSVYGKSGTASFTWNFGDGSAGYSGTNPPEHHYSTKGSYVITLIMYDPLACNNPDTVKKTIKIENTFVKAQANFPDIICSRAGAISFNSNSENASSVLWLFGDGKTSSEIAPTHLFDTGTYWITLIATNLNACNKSDTFKKKIVVMPGAVADFDFEPKIPIENDSTHFTNFSKNANNYLWIFGDESISYDVSPTHLYKKTGDYNTCLVAYGFGDCNDTLCKTVSAKVVPRIDVPTAFTPNKDGVNDILYVRGAAIQFFDFSIFNRWGELVFHSNSIEQGWDGTYKGKLQPMESYAYVLKATFITGETEIKKGNITLLE